MSDAPGALSASYLTFSTLKYWPRRGASIRGGSSQPTPSGAVRPCLRIRPVAEASNGNTRTALRSSIEVILPCTFDLPFKRIVCHRGGRAVTLSTQLGLGSYGQPKVVFFICRVMGGQAVESSWRSEWPTSIGSVWAGTWPASNFSVCCGVWVEQRWDRAGEKPTARRGSPTTQCDLCRRR